ncbi:uncharacterized protein LOC131150161 [Malania oleifera]|uniref:uncharacterized protein LOC131150161 n=1 Tax=Malania oleifera TaxID=397392 RepID=UPI0025AE10C3|nr:uncharacterized protein LOC131150161 [Malania oleifera]
MAEMARSGGECGCIIEQFTLMKPPSFAGGLDPIAVENWVQDVEEILAVLARTNEQKVAFATFKLTGEAKSWWRLVRIIEEQKPDPVPVSWSRFKELFFERYFLTIVRSVKVAEFLHLAQGQMTTFAEVVDRATIIESDMQRGTAAQGQRKRYAPQYLQASSSRGPWRGDRYGGSQGWTTGRGGPQGGRVVPICPRCGCRHSGKANLVADALSRKSVGPTLAAIEIQHSILMDLERLDIELVEDSPHGFIASLVIQPTLYEKIKVAQGDDIELAEVIARVRDG